MGSIRDFFGNVLNVVGDSLIDVSHQVSGKSEKARKTLNAIGDQVELNVGKFRSAKVEDGLLTFDETGADV